ncbi:hypothetical protein PF005_g10109 [Phytophthora fragariae]|uniref:Metallo-beta-lactamase domain-containing protein n=2 Tax=Phytophthora fragariae TaxID=53985 RepID=A0A6A3ZG72_9STRA|nr:hypothetical protein PF003_g23338 [Phytophthora fragariae]KAE8938773.1 hypothetical protein PF009_g11361 [Phytophthora fragariae]KAE9145727.1 hypothetical protein PF006_g9447 [Phytophthora fragariae]KAE9213670.1 hypothetical protein PF005_g10109 [Phytophthora fragariae]KAE9235638.1 hypothetical protein PF002_g11477 [Phytophthora fragariae]
MEVVILGCGTSYSTPSMRCLLGKGCDICREAQANPDSRNRRLNPSLLIRNLQANTNVLVDCGKTFREAALRIFPKIGVSAVHSVVLTHDHADACLGLDDLREVQPLVETVDPETNEMCKVPPESLEVHCCEDTSRDVRAKFPYLIMETSPSRNSELEAPVKKPIRWTAKLRLEHFEPWVSFEACGMEFLPIPVIHGAGYTSFGFEFGHEFDARFVYISDVSEFPEVTRLYINDTSKQPIDVLMIDALYLDKRNSAHMNLMQVVKEIETIRPKRTLLTGMSHELDYFTYGKLVKEIGDDKGLRIEMPYDGMRIAFP